MGKHGTEIERENPLFEGQSAEEFIKRWNAVTKAIKTRAEAEEMRILREGLFRPAGTKVLLQTMLQGRGGIR